MKKIIIRLILIVLLFVWMGMVFILSNEQSTQSSATSGKTIRAVINVIPKVRNLPEKEKEIIVFRFQSPARTLAHFILYAEGGLLVALLLEELNHTNRKIIIFSIVFILLYAMSDEAHQYFIPGRACELSDLLIDLSGGIVGSLLIVNIYNIVNKKKRGRNNG